MKIHSSLHTTLLCAMLLATTIVTGCGRTNSEQAKCDFYVTIAPLKYIIEQITGDDFSIGILVPAGASPETFEPTPKQYIALNEAQMIFSTGLIEFESALLERLADKTHIVDLSRNIPLIEGTCNHNHTSRAHKHGIDPHIWTSPRELKTMARNAYDAIITHYPDSVKYTESYNRLARQIEQLDEECRQRCDSSAARAFIIYHPALTYFARAYGIEQIAVEDEGKEPSAKHIANIIEQAEVKNIKSLLYQREYPRSVVEVLAEDTGLQPQEINPLDENPIEFIRQTTRLITE